MNPVKLTDAFERVIVINLPYRPDRREAVERDLATHGLADPQKLVWARAISGDMVPPPAWWKAGRGAWGCLHSHLRIVQDAIMDGLANYCVLEDDAVTHAEAPRLLGGLLAELPPDWDLAYLGGQHRTKPEVIRPGLLRGLQVNRTHAMALNARFFARFQQHITHAPDYIDHHAKWGKGCHIDHQLERLHLRRDRNVLCPQWWLFGQREGSSNISGKQLPRYWWHAEIEENWRDRPLAVVPADFDPACEAAARLHFGHNLAAGTALDAGLEVACRSAAALRTFCAMLARESLALGKLPAIPGLDPATVRSVWPGAAALEEIDFNAWLPVPRTAETPRSLEASTAA